MSFKVSDKVWDASCGKGTIIANDYDGVSEDTPYGITKDWRENYEDDLEETEHLIDTPFKK